MAKKSMREKFTEALTNLGEHVVRKTHKYDVFSRTKGGHYYLGAAGSLRFGPNVAGSRPVSQRFKDALLVNHTNVPPAPEPTKVVTKANGTPVNVYVEPPLPPKGDDDIPAFLQRRKDGGWVYPSLHNGEEFPKSKSGLATAIEQTFKRIPVDKPKGYTVEEWEEVKKRFPDMRKSNVIPLPSVKISKDTEAHVETHGHRQGSRKSLIHHVYDTRGPDAAFKEGQKQGLKDNTLRSWFHTWKRLNPKAAALSEVPATKAVKKATAAPAKSMAEQGPPPRLIAKAKAKAIATGVQPTKAQLRDQAVQAVKDFAKKKKVSTKK